MNKTVLVYLAGKISKNGWRNVIVPGLRNVASNAADILTVEPTPTIIERLYTTGPYFISCDHGCYHGDRSHGVSANGDTYCEGIGIKAPIVPTLCMEQIQKSNFVFALINDRSCYGTLCEIGYAIGRGIPVAVLFANKKLQSDMWFIGKMANIEMVISRGMLCDVELSKTSVEDPDISMMAYRIAYNLMDGGV